MSVRRLVTLLPLLAVLVLGSALTSPAGAVMIPATVPDPVATVDVGTITQGQNQGSSQTWVVPVTWDASATATNYTVKITSLDGTSTYATRDVSGTSTTFTTPDLSDNVDYKASVTPFNTDGPGSATTAQFTAIALDRTAPTATYTINHTSAYLTYPDGNFLADQSATFTITQTSLSDAATRKVALGDGSAQKTWSSGSQFTLTYTKAGTFTPHVYVTDAYGNTATVDLPAVHVLVDATDPVLSVQIPSPSNLISSWRVVRGTSTDAGTGVVLTGAVVAEKRGSIWYAYNFHKRTWVKGYTRLGKTLNRKAVPAFMLPTYTGAWHTPKIRGLRKGPLHVEAIAIDQNFNVSLVKVDRRIH